MQMDVDYEMSEGPSKMRTRSQTRAFGQNITNIVNDTRNKKRLSADVCDDRPLKRARHNNINEKIEQWTISNSDAMSPWDENDKDNELAVVDYVNDILESLKTGEYESELDETFDYMSKQSDINARMRTILLDWLVEVHLKFKLIPVTFHLCVNLLDRYLAKDEVKRNRLQLVGCTCLWIATKYHEIYAPEMQDFVYISDNAFQKEDLIETEARICHVLGFNFTVSTPLAFVERIEKVAVYGLKKQKEINFIKHYIRYCVEHCLMDYKMCRFLPSKIASATAAYALLTSNLGKWNDPLSEMTGYCLDDLAPLMRLINNAIMNPKCKHKAVRKKYSFSKFCKVEQIVKSLGKINIEKYLN